jgi:4-cresol dehydrogenase (hydroxylating)
MTRSDRINTAFDAWRDVLGAAYVSADATALQSAQRTTFATGQRVEGILRPASRSQVQACLRIANRYGVPLYPISGGKNWGYGSRVPPHDDCALLDLSRMNRIVDYDERLAYVSVEPGVTQRQLYHFLQERGGRLWLDATGADPDASIIGNTLERGFGHTPYGEHAAHSGNLEVVLPDGAVVHTGFGRFANAQAAPVYRWGVGPHLDGLFAQSNFGIVTQMTVWLMPAPDYFQAFYFGVARDDQLPLLVDALRPLRLNGTIKSAVHLANGYKVLSSTRQYPWREMHGTTPLSREVLNQFADAWGFGAWNGSGGLYGTRRQVAEARRLITRALKSTTRTLQFLDDRTLWIAQRLARPYQWITGVNLPEMLGLLRPVYGLLKGVPTSQPTASVYWRKRFPPPTVMDPDRDQCGLIWCSPIAPLDGRHAAAINRIVAETLPSHGFEPILTLTLLTERCLDCVIAITYDREAPGEDVRAAACYDELLRRLTQVGYYPYRLGIQSQGQLAGDAGSTQLLQTLKASLDPNRILAPGRYEMRMQSESGAPFANHHTPLPTTSQPGGAINAPTPHNSAM